MVTIDDRGDKVNRWVEHRFDTVTNEVVEVEHSILLAEASDEEHWMSRTTYDSTELDEGATICSMFIYASEEVRESIEKLLDSICKMLGDGQTPATEIPMPQLMRVLVGEGDCEGLILGSTMTATDILILLADCKKDNAETFRDALFEIYPNIDYMEIVY